MLMTGGHICILYKRMCTYLFSYVLCIGLCVDRCCITLYRQAFALNEQNMYIRPAFAW